MKLIKLQPAAFIDNLWETESGDLHAGHKLPYPFYVHPDGSVEGQDFWKGDPYRIVGFQRDLARQQVDVWWDEVAADPSKAVGLYIVSVSADGSMGVHTTAVASAEVVGED